MLAQLNKDDWNSLVKDALRKWYETDELNRHPLTEMKVVELQAQSETYAGDPYGRAKALRDTIKLAIGQMGIDGMSGPKPDRPEDPRWMDRHWRHHNILMLSYLNYSSGEVADRVGLALGGQYYRDQARAFEALAEVLRIQEGSPISDASTAALSYPSGAVKLNDPLYVERDVDADLIEALKHSGETITIRGSRQAGKTSLLTRGVYHGQRQFSPRIVYFDLQGAGEGVTSSLDTFLRTLIAWIFDELDLDLNLVETAWVSQLPAQRKVVKLLERHVLADGERPVMLAMDEIDRLQFTDFHAEFFGLIRSWHNRRASYPLWNKLSIIMAISTEPYLLIDDLNQSPFNVGQVLHLKDFSAVQTADLNNRHGAPANQGDLSRLLLLLSGHPFLTRVALYTMATSKMTWDDLESEATSDHGPFHQHLQLQYRLIIKDEKLRGAFRDIVHRNSFEDDESGFRLMKAGLVKRLDNGDYDCRCELYRRYFAEKL